MESIKRRPDGKWRARYRDEAGLEHSKHFDRRVDGQRWLDEIAASMITGTYADPRAGKVTFEVFYKQWAQHQVWASGTRRAMDLAAGSVTFGNVPLRSLRRSHLEKWVKAMTAGGAARGKPLAPGTVHTRVQNVRSVLRAAVADRVLSRDPSEGIALPRLRNRDAAMTIPTPSQVGALLDAADEAFKPFVALCAFAGLRLGEAAALQVADVDFLRRQLHVTRQVQRVNGGEVEIKDPKYGSERTVHLPDDLVAMLSEHIRRRRPGDDPQRWMFVGQVDSQPPHQNTIGHRWRRTLACAGLSGIKLHDLRHFFASGLIADGCDVVTVQRALGHAKATTTLNTYSHKWPSAEDRTRTAAAGMMVEARNTRPPTADYRRTGSVPQSSDLRR